jgi:hypothetical protein
VGMSVDSVAEEYYCNAKQLFFKSDSLGETKHGMAAVTCSRCLTFGRAWRSHAAAASCMTRPAKSEHTTKRQRLGLVATPAAVEIGKCTTLSLPRASLQFCLRALSLPYLRLHVSVTRRPL